MRILSTNTAILTAIIIAAASSSATVAQQPVTDGQGLEPQTRDELLRRVQEGSELRSDWIQGTSVKTPDGETIGTIGDLLIDRETGDVTAAILSVGGLLGLGAKSIAVTWQDLEMQYDASEITLPLSREEAEAAPEFEFRDQDQLAPPAGAAGGTTAPPTGQ